MDSGWVEPAAAAVRGFLAPEACAHWARLALFGRQADPFCCGPAWNLAYHWAVNRGRRLFCARSPQGLVMLSEFITPYGEPVLVPIEDSWLYGCPLLGPEAPSLLRAWLPFFEREYGVIPQIYVSGVIEDSFSASLLFHKFSRDFHIYRVGSNAQRSASLEGGADGWLARRSAAARASLKKSLRRAANLGVEFERARPGPEDAESVYERIIAVEEKSWKGIGGCGMTESPSREFYLEMIKLLAKEGRGLVVFARLAGVDVGFMFGGILGPFYRGQQFSYCQEHARLSLGNLLQWQTIHWLAELGIRRYDMGPAIGERMAYKARWAEASQDFSTWVLRKPC